METDILLVIPLIESDVLDIGLHLIGVLIMIKVGRTLVDSILSWIPFI